MRAAMAMIREHVADLPVVAVIHTHSHVDHFGGVRAVVSDEDLAAGRVRIVAPVDFLEESVSENILAGNVMSRRASYMYGNLAGWGPLQGIGAGLAQLTSSGAVSLFAPTDIISETGQELVIDGLRIVFQHTPGAEAPAELCFYLPDAPGPVHGGDRNPHAPQRLHVARREGPRRAGLVAPHQRRAPPVRRRRRRRLRVPPLADLGQRGGCRLPQGPARPLPLHPRRDAPPREPRLRGRPRSPR